MTERIWLADYPAGVPADIDPSQYPSLVALLENSFKQYADRTAYSFMGKDISYAETDAQSRALAAYLQSLGLARGDRVAIMMPNVPQYPVAVAAVLRAGFVVVNVNPLYTARELEHQMKDSGAKAIVIIENFAATLQKCIANTQIKHVVLASMGDRLGGLKGMIVNFVVRKVKKLVPAFSLPGAVRYNDAIAKGQGAPFSAPQIGPDDVAVLQYTGGTTGLPKGAMLSHGNVTAATQQAMLTATLGGTSLQTGCERMLVVLPLFHVYAMVVDMLLGIQIGAELVLCVRFDPGAALKDIASRRITCFPGVPTMFTAVVSHPDVASHDLRSLKVCNSGGAPMPVELLHRFEALTGCHLTEGWGMTETASLGTFTPAVGDAKPGSCGMPAPHVRLQFADVADPSRIAPQGERGEITIAGPNVMMGYWKNPKATAESFTPDGFFRTGDVGYMDEDGYVYIVDRTKDMLLCGGFNVYPRLIEDAIYAHPLVQEVMVIGIADAYRGESPKAYIKLKAGAEPITLESLKDFLKTRLGKHEMIYAMELRDDLPKTAVGKLSKKMLHDQLAQETKTA